MENYPIPPEFMAAIKLMHVFGRFLACFGLAFLCPFSVSAGLAPDSLRTEQREGQWCVLHQVEQGETLYGLSRRYGVSVQDLQAMNPESADLGVKIGQILVVPMRKTIQAQPAPASAVAPASAPVSTNAVAPASTPVSTSAVAPASAPVSTSAVAPASAPVQEVVKENPMPESAQSNQPIQVAKSVESTLPDVFWHVLEPDETLFTLSQRYQIPLQDLLRANPEIEPQQLKALTRLRIPSRSAEPAPSKPVPVTAAPPAAMSSSVAPAATPAVNPEHMPSAPSASQAVEPAFSPRSEPAEPSKAQPVAPPVAEPRTLQLQASPQAASGSVAVAGASHPTARYHTVSAGETLYGIARQYPGTTPALLQSWNGLADNNLRSGQNLIVGWAEPKSSEVSSMTMKGQSLPAEPSGMEEAGMLTSASPRDFSASSSSAEPLVRSSAKARGIATWIDATSPESENGALLALHNEAPIGSWIDVRNLMNNRTVRAKVVGRLPQNLDDSRAIVKLSQGAAKQLQAHDPKVLVEVIYTTAP
ncbi:MAG: LysM peptidoglycan-binding domain-containing protein [Bacteroidetes bacterium]|nr:LysM peptidoglycan-binding domain-containing protein [Bacteroidota bacterium]